MLYFVTYVSLNNIYPILYDTFINWILTELSLLVIVVVIVIDWK